MKSVLINPDRKEPVVEINGVAVMTRDGVPIEVQPRLMPAINDMPTMQVADETPTVML